MNYYYINGCTLLGIDEPDLNKVIALVRLYKQDKHLLDEKFQSEFVGLECFLVKKDYKASVIDTTQAKVITINKRTMY